MAKNIKIVTYQEWRKVPGNEDVKEALDGLMDSDRAHWFEFAIDANGEAILRMTDAGRLEHSVEELLLAKPAGHS